MQQVSDGESQLRDICRGDVHELCRDIVELCG